MSSQSSNSKAWIYGLVAGAAVIGGAIVFHILSNKEESGSDLFDEIDLLGPPKKAANGFLAYDYFKKVFVLIQKHSKAKQAQERKEMIAKRRKYLKEGNEELYKGVVREMIEKEEATFQGLMMEAIEHLGFNEQDFMMMYQTYMQNPQYQQDLMQA